MRTIVIRLAGTPQGKGRARTRIVQPRGGGGEAFATIFTPAKTRKFEAALRAAAALVMKGQRRRLEGPLQIDVVVVMPIPKSWPKRTQQLARIGVVRPTTRPDWDNFAKVCDALNGCVWRDDAEIVDGKVTKWYGAPEQVGIEIIAKELDEADLRRLAGLPVQLSLVS